MNDDQFTFFKQLIETTGPSGYEENAQQVFRNRVQGIADTIHTDLMGNVIAAVNPEGKPRIMLDGHIDEIGFQVKYIDDNGFVYFSPIGGLDASSLAGNRVRFIGKNGPVLGVVGRKPVHYMEQEDRKKAPEIKNMWIDIGAKNRQEAEQLLAIGDGGGRAFGLERLQGNIVTANSIDDRVGVYIVAEVLRNVSQQKPGVGVYVSSSVQEEIGLRGARASAYSINPEIGIAVEVTHASDQPEVGPKEGGEIKLGGGPSISRGANTNPRLFQLLIAAAEKAGVPCQIEPEPRGTGTDANAMQLERGGMATAIISVPLRYMHSPSEVISLDDVDAAVKLLTQFVLDVNENINLTP